MSDHIHEWKPIIGQMGRYECDCGALGSRNRKGLIVDTERPPRRTERWTARGTGRITGGRIPPKPGH